MAVSDWLNANVIGNVSLGDLGSSAIDFYDTWQGREGAKDSIDAITQGYDKGINYLQETGDESKDLLGGIYDTNMENIQPYLGAGNTALDHYMGLTQDPSTIAQDPAYQWRFGEGERSVGRSLAAAGYADPMGSGANPVGITEWAQGFASDELDRALSRDLPIIEGGQSATRTGVMAGDTYGRGISNINQYMGVGIADMYRGQADALATKDLIDSMAMSGYLKNASGMLEAAAGNAQMSQLLGAALQGGTTNTGESLWGMLAEQFGFDVGDEGIMNQVMDSLNQQGGGVLSGSNIAETIGGALDPFGDMGLVDENGLLLGIDWDNLLASAGGLTGIGGAGYSALGSGELFGAASGIGETALGTGSGANALGMTSGNLASFGGDYSAALSSEIAAADAVGGTAASVTGFATWAGYAAAGIGGIFALKSVVTALRGDSQYQRAVKEIADSKDPLGDIQKLSSEDLPRDTRHSEDNWFRMNDSASRGSLYSTVFTGMTPEDAMNLTQHQDFSDISNDLFQYAKSGAGYGGKNDTDPTQALIALYPSMEKDILTMAAGGNAKWNKGQDSSTFDDIGGLSQMFQQDSQGYYQKIINRGAEAEKRVRDFMRQMNIQYSQERQSNILYEESQLQGYV